MFVGHYAPAFVLRSVSKSPRLGTGFLAVQLVDIGFFSLTYLGVEKWRSNPSLQGFMPVDLYFMPYTHSLLAGAIWALAAGLLVALFTPSGRKFLTGSIVSVLVLSHWFLDLPVHRHDLPLLSDAEQKLGYALWDQPLVVMPLELGILLASFALYLATTKPRGAAGRILPWLMLSLLFVAAFINWFTPPAADVATFSAMGLAAYLTFAALAWVLDRYRE